MEREILFTGLGGQSVQLAAHTLARAAVAEGREALLLGIFGGTMRGGPTESTLIVGDGPIVSPPIVAQAWSALVMHHAFFEATRSRLRPGAVVVVNASLFEGALDPGLRAFEVPATRIASDLGNPLAASLVLVGAHAALTGLVGEEALLAGMTASVPAYRRQHLEANGRALRAGFSAVAPGVAPAWNAGRAA